jgi:tetratricopeptide (TPR) repeat protein
VIIIRPRSSILLACALWLVASVGSFAQETNEDAPQDMSTEDRIEYFEDQAQELQEDVRQLVEYYEREADDRDKLVLQQHFVLGRDFHFLIADYRTAAEIFYGIVNHPSAQNFPNLSEAQYYLAESHFHMQYYQRSFERFSILRDIGAESEYYGPALVRLLQISVYLDDYSSAQRYYSELLANLPADYDGSLGMYILGKSLSEKGESERGEKILNDMPELSDYFPVGQYFLAVQDVRRGAYAEAINRLRLLKNSLAPESLSPAKKAVYSQMNLALGRLHYELDDYPQAVSSYLNVSVDSPSYGEAMYENLWVLLTRNDNLLRRMGKELREFDKLNRDYGDFTDILEITEGDGAIIPFVGDVDSLQDDMSDVRKMLDQMDDHLTNMQQDAVNTFVQLARNAPNSPFIPEAELLIGKAFVQAEDYNKARRLFEIARRKYSDYHAKLRSTASGLHDDQVLIEFVERGLGDEGNFLGSVPPGVPEEIAYWMAADVWVQKVFAIYESALNQRRDLDEIRSLISNIELELAKLERDDSFPIFKGAHQRSLELLERAELLRTRISELEGIEGLDSDDAETLSDLKNKCESQTASLNSLLSTLEGKKRKILARYRQTFQEIIAPIPTLRPEVTQVYALATDAAVRTARLELSEIQLKLSRYEQKARVGIIDADYRAAEMSARKIKSIQKEMNEELRRFRMQYRMDKVMKTDEPEDEMSAEDILNSEDEEGAKEADAIAPENEIAPKENQ